MSQHTTHPTFPNTPGMLQGHGGCQIPSRSGTPSTTAYDTYHPTPLVPRILPSHRAMSQHQPSSKPHNNDQHLLSKACDKVINFSAHTPVPTASTPPAHRHPLAGPQPTRSVRPRKMSLAPNANAQCEAFHAE